MRPIKFRAWDGEKFWYSDSPNAEFIFGGKGNGVYLNGVLQFDITEKNTDRYTSLKDKNGVEIYEGDIVQQTMKRTSKDDFHWRYVVRQDESKDSQFGNSLFSWTIMHNASTDENDTYTFKDEWLDVPVRNYVKGGKNCEVIGNRFENPELLATKETE